MRLKRVYVLILLLTMGLSLDNPPVNAQSTEVKAETKSKIEATYRQLAKHFQANEIAAATPLLSEECLGRLAFEWLLLSHQVSQEARGTELSESLRKVASKHELAQAIPESFFTGEISPAKFERLEKSVVEACGAPQKQAAVVSDLRSVFVALPKDSEFRAWMPEPFGGEIKSLESQGKIISAFVDSQAGEVELTFVPSDAGWILDDFMLDMSPQPLPLIPNIQLTGKTIEGEELSLASLKGKVVLIDFWGTWCPPCVAELAPLKKIHSALNERGFEIVGVAADDRETLKPFVKSIGLGWKNIVDADGSIAESFGVQAYPTTLLINREGEHIASDLFGVELLDAAIRELKLDPAKFKDLRIGLEDDSRDEGERDEGERDEMSEAEDGVGFEFADSDGDGEVSRKELKKYLATRLQAKLPHRKIFKRLDADASGAISPGEFDSRHDVLDELMGPDFLSGEENLPEDPGKGYVLYTGANQPVDDRRVFGAVYHRYMELFEKTDSLPLEIDEVPTQIASAVPTHARAATGLDDLAKATAIFVGGGDYFFTAGAVLISEDGLAVTNYHVAQSLSESPCFCLTHDGKVHRVIEFVAGNRSRDVALIRLEGEQFSFVSVATETPAAGDDLEMLHHSENRFFTYDRGYVMRHPIIGKHPWMEVSMDYAPGGSGCGIYNKDRQLVGLVSTIQFGDGPSIAEPFTDWEESDEADWEESDGEAIIMVKQAVSLSAIRSLWKQTP